MFSKAERSFYEVLRGAVGSEFTIFAKVRLLDLVKVPSGTERILSWKARIDRKHVDFVLCEKEYLKTVLVIELDDSSHERPATEKRDQFVDKVLAAASIPIMRVKVALAYDQNAIRDEILKIALKK